MNESQVAEKAARQDAVTFKVAPQLKRALEGFASGMGLDTSNFVRMVMIEYMRTKDPAKYKELTDESD